MDSRYTKELKAAILARRQSGQRVADIAADTGVPRSTIYAWLKNQAVVSTDREDPVKALRDLKRRVTRLEGIIEILKKVGCTAADPLDVKLPALEALYGQYSVHMLCEALEVPRGTFYNYILRNKRSNTWYAMRREDLREDIQRIYDDSHQVFGAAKICAVMRDSGTRISKEMVRELMRDMGLMSIRQDAKALYDREKRRYQNHLNQQFDVSRPNEVWVSDVTCFRVKEKTYYICAILDLFSRRVIGYRIGNRNSTQLARSTFQQAYAGRQPSGPLTFHTDRGSNYASKAFCSCLHSAGVIQSFSRVRVPYDNSVMESFFSSLKREELYRTKYRSEQEFRSAVEQYIAFYNERRPHAKYKYKTPVKKEEEYRSAQALNG